ncbi:MAG: SRPBCC family protein [Deltaproteobacteria bacterium]|nr:SRPBCC family protein [Deltaproteobacteria bacterium]
MSSSRASVGLSMLAAMASIACALGVGAQERASGFTREERARLDQGELVIRPHVADAREPWMGGTSFQIVDRPVAEVWRALEDLPAYRHMLPGTSQTRDDGLDRGARVLYVQQSQLGVSASYSLRLRHDAHAHRVSFELDRDRPHDVEDARGFLEIRSYQRTRTVLTWALRAVLGMGAMEPMVRGLVEPWLLRVPETAKHYLEGWGRDRYRE